MKYIYSILISLFLLGCSTDNIDYTLARMSGNKPAGFFYFANSYDANRYMFEHKDFNISMIQTNQQDWIDMGGWHGAYIYDGIGLGLEIKEVRAYGDIFGYGINIFSSTYPYTIRERLKEEMKNIFVKNIDKVKKQMDESII